MPFFASVDHPSFKQSTSIGHMPALSWSRTFNFQQLHLFKPLECLLGRSRGDVGGGGEIRDAPPIALIKQELLDNNPHPPRKAGFFLAIRRPLRRPILPNGDEWLLGSKDESSVVEIVHAALAQELNRPSREVFPHERRRYAASRFLHVCQGVANLLRPAVTDAYCLDLDTLWALCS
jgi:hypothetical protein